MRKPYRLILPLLFVPLAATAQQTPKVEVFGGYSNLEANLNAASFNLNGTDFSVTENVNPWFGGTLDFTSHFGTEAGIKVNTETLTYGPVISYRKHPSVVPFGHVLLGAVRGSSDYLDISKPAVHFAVAAGGGIDVKVTDRVALRLIQADYLMTRFSSSRQDNIRLSAGIVLRFGRK
jgi:Outer membrane protein beta-barrel domain